MGIDQSAIQDIIDVARRLDDKGLVNAFEGNISIKRDGYLYITPSGKSKVTLTPEKICVFNEAGEQVNGIYGPSSELKMHRAVYEMRENMENYPAVDAERLAILGWSMGAKVASKFAAAHPEMKVLVLWSPAVQDGLGDLYFMKQLSTFAEDENLDNMEYARKLQSEAMENGRAFFSQEYNAHDVYLSKEFFSEIEEATPIQWINDYSGSKLAVIPSGDTVIPKKNYEDLCSKTDVRRIFIDSDHDLGFEGSSKDATLSAIEVTVGYLYKELM